MTMSQLESKAEEGSPTGAEAPLEPVKLPKAQSAYFIFAAEVREELKAEHPGTAKLPSCVVCGI